MYLLGTYYLHLIIINILKIIVSFNVCLNVSTRICRSTAGCGVADKFFIGKLMNRFTRFHRDAVFRIFEKRFDEKTAVFTNIWTRYKVFALKKKDKK